MRPTQISIGGEAAIRLGQTNWWEGKTARQIALFQMRVCELCMPFGLFHQALEEALGRPVWTHELGLNWEGIEQELLGNAPAPTMDEIVALIPEEKRVVVQI